MVKSTGKSDESRFRFQVSEKDIPYSDSWTLWRNGADIYLAPKGVSATSKISLHASGDCRWALTSQLASHSPPMPAGRREIVKWRREAALKNVEHSQALSIRFIPVTRGTRSQAALNPKACPLPYPPKGGCTEVAVFFSSTDPRDWNSRIWLTKNIICCWRISGGLFATFRWRIAPIGEQEMAAILNQASETAVRMVVGEEDPAVFSAGISDAMIGRSFSHFGQIDTLLALPNLAPGMKASWWTESGHKFQN